MVARAGRQVVFEWNEAEIAGVREKGLAMNGEAINVTSDEDEGVRKLLAVSQEDTVTVTLSGVAKSDALKTDWFAGTRNRTMSLTYPNSAELSGEFWLSSYEETDPYQGEATFTATLESMGAVTFTPGT